MAKNILLLAGGDSSEHEISLISSKFVESQLKKNPDFNVISCVLHNNLWQLADDAVGYFAEANTFVIKQKDGSTSSLPIDCVVPCLHGFPGETGDIQSLFELHQVPYIGCDKEASLNCFNKVTTKFYLSALNITNTPFAFVSDDSEASLKAAHETFERFNGDVYVKAASEGSSIGCYHVTKAEELDQYIKEALGYSTLVLIEKTIEHRELEVAAFEYEGELHVTEPGEIIIPSDVFYTFDEKYSKDSGTVTTTDAENLTAEQRAQIRDMALRAFKGLNLRHLSRIDFFLGTDGTVYINEINTFPGMTPISMFPKLVERAGYSVEKFFIDCVERAIAEAKA